jgi:hypothetical protein
MAYTDATALKRYLGISASTDDTLLGECITRAQAVIDSITGRTFEASADTTRYFDSCAIDGRELILDHDLCAITTVTNGDDVVVSASDYTVRPRNRTPWYALRLKLESEVLWDGTTDEIAILGKWAYSTTAPNTIVQVAIRLAAWFYKQKDNHADMDRALVVGDMTVLPAKLPSDIAELLKPYRRLVP